MIVEIYKKFKIDGFKKFIEVAFQEMYTILFYKMLRNSYSQMGEDLEIDKILGYKKNVFYIDIGANDPVRFSNTNRFYKKGWQGINIEPNPNVFRNIDKARLRDTNLNVGIAYEKGNLTFYSFFPDTLSTFSEHQAKEYLRRDSNCLKSGYCCG